MKKIWDVLMPFLIYYAVHVLSHVLLVYLAGLSISLIGGGYASLMTANAQTVNGILNALSLLIGMAAVLPMAKKEPAVKNKIKKSGIVSYLLLAVFAVTLALGTNIFFFLTGLMHSSKTYNNVAASQHGIVFSIGLILYGAIAPVAEEVIFRGIMYNRLKKYFPWGISAVACGIMFGFYHGNMIQGIYGSILGIAITFMYEKYGSFKAPLLFHSLANVSVYIIGYISGWPVGAAAAGSCILLFLVTGICLWAICAKKGEQSE